MSWLKYAIDYGIIGFLLILSIFSVGIAIERFLFIKKVDMDRYQTKQEMEIDLTRGIHWIATVGANAPYIGLLGTVLGIMLTFYTVGQEGFVDTKKVMVGLALALKATAMGLFVAIPSTVLHNTLLRRIREKLALWEAKNGRQRI